MIIEQLLIVYSYNILIRRTKICMKTSMVQNRLNFSSIRNIEHQLSKSIDNKDIFVKFAKKNIANILQ